MLTRSLVTVILLLAAVSCDRDDLPTQPTGLRPPGELATDITGEYQLTFTASPSCALPTQLMKRTYKSNIRAWVKVPDVCVDLWDAAFFHDWAAGFAGTRNGDTIQFTIAGMVEDPFSYSLAESIEGTKWLTYDGTAAAAIRGKNISGAFDGQIALRDNASSAILAECRATDHKIAFAR